MLQDPIHMSSVDQMPSFGVTTHSCLSPQGMWGMLLTSVWCLLIEVRTFRKPRACIENWNQGSVFLGHPSEIIGQLSEERRKLGRCWLVSSHQYVFFRRYNVSKRLDKLWNHCPTYVLSEKRNWDPAYSSKRWKTGQVLGSETGLFPLMSINTL